MFRSTTIIMELVLSLAKVILKHSVKYVLILIICINCNWVDTRWQWLFYMYTKYDTGYY
jgi:hypothetical protein